MKTNSERLLAFILRCFLLATAIFFISVSSEFSVRMYYSSTDPYVQVVSGLLAIFFITIILMLIFLIIPDLRKAFYRSFGMEE